MENVWITLITVMGGVVSTLIGFLIKNHKIRKQEEKENNQLKELCNYAFGQIDMIIQDSIKVEPEVREAMRKASKKYHSLDLVKVNNKNNKEADNGK